MRMKLTHVKPYALSVGELRRLSAENKPIVIDLAGVSWLIAFPIHFVNDIPDLDDLKQIQKQTEEIALDRFNVI